MLVRSIAGYLTQMANKKKTILLHSCHTHPFQI
nr:MAG TPA: hypothetical protein [Caudoviricetes sp.]